MPDPFSPVLDDLIRFTVDAVHDGQQVRNTFHLTTDLIVPVVTLDELLDDLETWWTNIVDGATRFITDEYRVNRWELATLDATFPGPPPRLAPTLAVFERVEVAGPIGQVAGDPMASHNCASITYRTNVKHAPVGFGRLIHAGARIGPLVEAATGAAGGGNLIDVVPHADMTLFADTLPVQRSVVGAGGNMDYTFCVASPKFHIDSGLPTVAKPPVVVTAKAATFVSSQVSRKRRPGGV